MKPWRAALLATSFCVMTVLVGLFAATHPKALGFVLLGGGLATLWVVSYFSAREWP